MDMVQDESGISWIGHSGRKWDCRCYSEDDAAFFEDVEEQKNNKVAQVILVRSITHPETLRYAVSAVFSREIKSSMGKWYGAMHSPVRTQLYEVYGFNTPYSVIMQLRTHEKHMDCFLCEPGRPDTGTKRAQEPADNYRDAKRNMYFLCNAEVLINMAHKRLCSKAEKKTRDWMTKLKKVVSKIDPELAEVMVPMCEYRGGICGEFSPCGHYRSFLKSHSDNLTSHS